MTKFKDEYTKEALAEHLNRYVKWQWHDEEGNKIVEREEHEKNVEDTKENFTNRILKENLDAYTKGNAPCCEPKLFDGCSLSDFTSDKYPPNFLHNMYERAVDKESFWLHGEYGSGKSRFLWAYCKHLFLELGHRDIIFTRFSDIFKHAKMNYGSFEFDDFFKRMMTCKILLVDDIKVMNGRNANQYESFVDLLDSRVENDLTTCFTSNVSFKSLAGDESESKRISTRIERIIKKKTNLVYFGNKYYDF